MLSCSPLLGKFVFSFNIGFDCDSYLFQLLFFFEFFFLVFLILFRSLFGDLFTMGSGSFQSQRVLYKVIFVWVFSCIIILVIFFSTQGFMALKLHYRKHVIKGSSSH